MTFTIGSTDFSGLTKKLGGYTVRYVKREGVNSGIMQDGTKTYDLLAYKAVITWELIGLSTAQLSQVLTACMVQYATVTFDDPYTGSTRQSSFIPDVGDADFAFRKNGVNWWKDGLTITMEER